MIDIDIGNVEVNIIGEILIEKDFKNLPFPPHFVKYVQIDFR